MILNQKAVPFGDLRMYVNSPRNFIEPNPTSQSVWLGAEPIILTAIAPALKINHSYLSRIMAGEREPRTRLAHKIADALGIGLEDFLKLVEVRKEVLRRKSLEPAEHN